MTASGDILSTLRADGHFTILLNGLRQTNLTGVLRNNRNLTLFAPTDEAFRALPPETLRALQAPRNADLFQRVLTYHLINARVDGADMRGARGRALTVEGADLRINGAGRAGQAIEVEDARMTQTDVVAANGVIHVIDKVLIPSDVARNGAIPGLVAPIGAPIYAAAQAPDTAPAAPAPTPADATAMPESGPTQPAATLEH